MGYSSANKFANLLIKKSTENINFIADYRNRNKSKLGEILNFFLKLFKIKIKYEFQHKIRVTNKKKIKTIYSNENSLLILKKYYNKYKNEKKNVIFVEVNLLKNLIWAIILAQTLFIIIN